MSLADSLRKELESQIAVIERDTRLVDENNFANRVAAIDWLGFHVLDSTEPISDDAELRIRAQALIERLEKSNEQIFSKLRNEIRAKRLLGDDLRKELERYCGKGNAEFAGYDCLDELLQGVTRLDTMPQETRKLESEMVFYQPTPARIVLKCIDQAMIQPHDIFYDLGSGLGHVCIWVNLVAGAETRGVEFEPAFCDYARTCAEQLNLSKVEFVNCDARDANFIDGTIFFMYTPFKGKILMQVLQRLKQVAQQHSIRIGTFGPCSQVLAEQDWLHRIAQNFSGEYEFAVFES